MIFLPDYTCVLLRAVSIAALNSKALNSIAAFNSKAYLRPAALSNEHLSYFTCCKISIVADVARYLLLQMHKPTIA